MEELMDYVERRNFDFFRYRYELGTETKSKFLSACEKVMEGAQKAAKDMMLLGWRLKKLKDGRGWTEVLNPEDGMTFIYSSFEQFCKYAFGFSKTRTSNLMNIAQFIDVDEETETVRFKSERYAAMNTSQLVEIAPLSSWQQEYFTADMPVKDMRMCKRYMDSGAFWNDKGSPNFDLKESAQKWTDNLERSKEMQAAQEVDAALHRAAQAQETDMDSVAENEFAKVSTSEFWAVPKDDWTDEGEVSDSSSDVGTDAYCIATFAGVRDFLGAYEEWDYVSHDSKFFDKITRFRFKNGAELFAATLKNSVSLECDESKTLIYYFLALGAGIPPIKVAKRKLEIWLRSYATVLM